MQKESQVTKVTHLFYKQISIDWWMENTWHSVIPWPSAFPKSQSQIYRII